MPPEQGSKFAQVLSDAIKARGLSLERIRHRLEESGVSISVATLSYWQNGRSQPARAQSQKVLSALETVLDLPANTLTSLAPVAHTRRRSGNGAELQVLPHSVEDALEHAGLSTQGLRTISTHVTLSVTAQRGYSSEVVRKVVQCLVPGTRSFPVVVADAGLADGRGQEVQGLSNCTTGRRFHVPEDNLVLTEMLLPRPLRQGELLMLEYLTTFEPGPRPGEDTKSLGLAVQRMNVLVMEVHFSERNLPSRVVACTGAAPEDLADEIDLDVPGAVDLPVDGGLAQMVHVDVQPGVYFLRWEW
ncbi:MULTISPECIES: hypothetical protein [unclassified Luteococcus]|uniref:hypothetical protein n=1 Tax=unclassified Luteococcus TaxID=2639923 RepID=UPI00313EEAD6